VADGVTPEFTAGGTGPAGGRVSRNVLIDCRTGTGEAQDLAPQLRPLLIPFDEPKQDFPDVAVEGRSRRSRLTTIYGIESGHREARPTTLLKILQALEKTPKPPEI